MPGIFKTKKQGGLKILFVSTEAAPFAKIGGLGSVMQSLPLALRLLGHDARVFIPKYLGVDDEENNLKMGVTGLKVPTDNEEGDKELICNVKICDDEREDSVITYFLENREYYEKRANVYGYADDPIRWALLSRGVLEFLRTSASWIPDVIVATDWQTGFLPNYLKTSYKDDPILSKIRVIFSIHNLSYQGMFDHRFVQEMDYDDGHSGLPEMGGERILKINGMRRGIIHSDLITTVSPTYAKEIMTKEYGEGLDDLLRERRAVITGILNGIEYSNWNPCKDPYLEHAYSKTSIEKRAPNKEVLQNRFGLSSKEDVFVIGIVSRLASQKGFNLLYPIAETLLNELPIQLVVVGEGSSDIMKFFYDLEKEYPRQVATHLKFDKDLPHLVYGGADAILVPSRFEPCGLIQMEAMRFGAIPIVRETGGLADTVEDFDASKGVGTGFSFEDFDSNALLIAIIRAIENYRHKASWQRIQERAMNKDFSWPASAKKYVDLFNRAMKLTEDKNRN